MVPRPSGGKARFPRMPHIQQLSPAETAWCHMRTTVTTSRLYGSATALATASSASFQPTHPHAGFRHYMINHIKVPVGSRWPDRVISRRAPLHSSLIGHGSQGHRVPRPKVAERLNPERADNSVLVCALGPHGRQSADPAKKHLKHGDDLFNKPLLQGDEIIPCLRQSENAQPCERFT